MSARAMLATVAACVALLGCATVSPEKELVTTTGILASRCLAKSCVMLVTVEGSPPAVKVSEPRLQVPSNNPRALMIWVLQDGYAFHDGSIRFKGENAEIAKRNMIQPSHSEQVYVLINTHQDFGDFKYEVTVYDAKTGKPYVLDPLIVNN